LTHFIIIIEIILIILKIYYLSNVKFSEYEH